MRGFAINDKNKKSEKTDLEGRWRLGVVSYLNAKPLIAGLDAHEGIELVPDVPARLADLLDRGAVDAALVPIVDFLQPGRKWQIVSDACIGCDGETLTVRVFSRVKPEEVATIHVDGDSHTSVVLATIIWRGLFGRNVDIVPLDGNCTLGPNEAALLIGDKVVNRPRVPALSGLEIETDLGTAWKSLTSLPFVFAAWAAPVGKDVSELAAILSTARDLGEQSVELIAADYGPGLGWPIELAKRYLTSRLKFGLGEKQKAGMAEFLRLAQMYDLVESSEGLVFA